MSLIQIKIIYTYYTRKRTTPIFISEDELLSDDFQSFRDRLITEVPHLAKLTCSPLQLTVLDDQLEVDLSPEYFPLQMRELLNKRKEITLQAFTFESPGSGTAVPVESHQSLPRTEVRSRRALELPALFDDSDSEVEDNVHEDEDLDTPAQEIYLSPVDKLVESKQREIKTKKEKIAEKTAEIEDLEESFLKPFALDMSRPACSKCHLRAGHTRPNCQNELCTSARLCGDLKRHPEQKKEIKDLQSELKLLNTTLKRQNDELSNIQATVKSSKRTFSQLIHSDLINSNKQKYISKSLNGREIINWMQLNTDSKKIEKMCGGKVPGSKKKLQEIIVQHDTQEQQIAVNSKTNKTNQQVRQLWEKKGVVFPGSGPIYCHEEKSATSSRAMTASIPIPSTTEEEMYQTNLAIRESEREATKKNLSHDSQYFPMPVNKPPVMVQPSSSSYPQLEHLGYGQNSAGTPIAFPMFFNPHVNSAIPAGFMPTAMEAQMYHNYIPHMPPAQTFSRELQPTVLNTHNINVEHMSRDNDSTACANALTIPAYHVQADENPLDILTKAITDTGI